MATQIEPERAHLAGHLLLHAARRNGSPQPHELHLLEVEQSIEEAQLLLQALPEHWHRPAEADVVRFDQRSAFDRCAELEHWIWRTSCMCMRCRLARSEQGFGLSAQGKSEQTR